MMKNFDCNTKPGSHLPIILKLNQQAQKLRLLAAPLLLTCLVTACVHHGRYGSAKDGAPQHAFDANNIPNAVPRPLPRSRYGNPSSYKVNGKRYFVLESASGYDERGIASWYGTKFHGHLTSSREPYNMFAMTAASPVLPIPCFVRVTNLENGRRVIVKVNDRGPFAPNRIIDLSYAAAKKLGYAHRGTSLVEVTALDTQPSTLASTLVAQPHLYLQVGAFHYYLNAEQLKTRLSHLVQRPVRIDRESEPTGPVYRVRIGPLRGVGESDKLQRRLMDRGFGEALTVVS